MPSPAWDSIVPSSCEELHVVGHEHPIWLMKVKNYIF